MIPFVLGFIGGFAFAVLIFTICILAKASGLRSREEETWGNEEGCTMQGLWGEDTGMSSDLQELHRMESEAVRSEGKGDARERVD